jgi:hypothetical protein
VTRSATTRIRDGLEYNWRLENYRCALVDAKIKEPSRSDRKDQRDGLLGEFASGRRAMV